MAFRCVGSLSAVQIYGISQAARRFAGIQILIMSMSLGGVGGSPPVVPSRVELTLSCNVRRAHHRAQRLVLCEVGRNHGAPPGLGGMRNLGPPTTTSMPIGIPS